MLVLSAHGVTTPRPDFSRNIRNRDGTTSGLKATYRIFFLFNLGICTDKLDCDAVKFLNIYHIPDSNQVSDKARFLYSGVFRF
jgi:hypothetical protein